MRSDMKSLLAEPSGGNQQAQRAFPVVDRARFPEVTVDVCPSPDHGHRYVMNLMIDAMEEGGISLPLIEMASAEVRKAAETVEAMGVWVGVRRVYHTHCLPRDSAGLEVDQAEYWDARYRERASQVDVGERRYKARYVNQMLSQHEIGSVIDWGCGNGDQLAHIPLGETHYVGTDISMEAIRQSRERFPGRYFIHRPKLRLTEKAEAGLSLEVIPHQVTEIALVSHLDDLFGRASRLVVIFSTNMDTEQLAIHVRHHWFTPIVAIRYPEWRMLDGGNGREFGSLRAFYAYEPR